MFQHSGAAIIDHGCCPDIILSSQGIHIFFTGTKSFQAKYLEDHSFVNHTQSLCPENTESYMH